MTIQYPANQFDEKTLKNVISCAVLMSSIDGQIHEKEWEIIQSFADQHWKVDYQSFAEFQQRTIREIELSRTRNYNPVWTT